MSPKILAFVEKSKNMVIKILELSYLKCIDNEIKDNPSLTLIHDGEQYRLSSNELTINKLK